MPSQVQLLDLPSEIILKILLLLPPSSILTITRVSKLLLDLYRSSSNLQYRVALDHTLQVDVDDCNLPTSEKLNLLTQRDQRWRSLKWNRRQAVTCDKGNSGSLYDLLGGVLAVVSEQSVQP